METRERIKAYRQSLGLSQTEAARQWKVRQSTLSKIESGDREIGPWSAYQIEQGTGGQLKNLWKPRARNNKKKAN